MPKIETKLKHEYGKVPGALLNFCVEHNIKEIPKCEYCDQKVSYNKAYAGKGFTRFCSTKCRSSYKAISSLPEESYKKLKNKRWMYKQRIELERSKEDIARELDCSVTPVNKWLKKHKIPVVRYNESLPKVKQLLKNKKWVKAKYKGEKLSCLSIAEEIGCSKSLVSVWIRKHGIEATPANEYTRKQCRTSSVEKEIVEYISSIYSGEIQCSNRTIMSGLELDIYLPELKLAIEYNGLPWHCEIFGNKGRQYHLNKTILCEKKGIELLHIFSHEWSLRKEIWKSMISSKLFKNNTIYARKCKILLLSASEKNFFMERNHLQGKDMSNVKIGLKYNGETVAVMTFVKSRFNNKAEWELSRYCGKKFNNIIGGFSKLLRWFIKKYNPKSIISYADRKWSKGNIYFSNKFKLIRVNGPSYHYVKNNRDVYHRYSFQKSKLGDVLEEFDPTLTEWENMQMNNWNRFWDCGTLSFLLKIK